MFLVAESWARTKKVEDRSVKVSLQYVPFNTYLNFLNYENVLHFWILK